MTRADDRCRVFHRENSQALHHVREFREYILSDEAAEFLKARARAVAGGKDPPSRAFDGAHEILKFDDSLKRKRKRFPGSNANETMQKKKFAMRPPAMTRERKADMESGETLNVCAELRAVMRTLGDGDYEAFPPNDLLRSVWKLVPSFAGNEQQDAHEFMRFLLDRLRKELSGGRRAAKMKNAATPRMKEHSPCEGGLPQPPTRARSLRSRSGRSSPSSLTFLRDDPSDSLASNDAGPGSSTPVNEKMSDDDRDGGYIIVSRWGAKKHKVGCPCRPCKSRRRKEGDVEAAEEKQLTSSLSTPGSVFTSPSHLLHAVTADEVRKQLNELMSPSTKDRTSSQESPPAMSNLPDTEDAATDKIMELFGGVAVTRVTCMNCNQTTTRRETFLDLSLPIPPVLGKNGSQPSTPVSPSVEAEIGEGPNGEVTLQQCLAAFTRNEMLSGHGRYFCETCGEVQRATKSTKIGKLPPVLCLHLKRFTWKGHASRTKITSDVDFPLDNLDLAPYSEFDDGEEEDHAETNTFTSEMKPRRTPRRSATSTPAPRLEGLYDLVAVVTHHGSCAGTGHYTACARDLDSPHHDDWQHFNDDEVNSLKCEEVRTGQGYLFLYARKSA